MNQNATSTPLPIISTATMSTTLSGSVFHVTKTQTSFIVFGFIATMTMTILGNLLVLVVLFRQRLNRNIRVTNSFLASLAVIDLLMAVLVLPFSISINVETRWVFGKGMCNFNGMVTNFVGSASILTMATISIDRHQAIASATRKRLTLNQALIMICVTWIWALVVSMLPVIGWNEYLWTPGSSVCKFSLTKETGFAFLLGLTSFLIPFATMLVCYVRVYLVLRRHKRQLAKWKDKDMSGNKKAQAKNMQREGRATLIVFVILSIFCLCWVPYVILVFTRILNPRARIPSGMLLFAGWSTTAHAAANPIIYVVLNKKFRIEAAKVLPCLRCFWAKIGPLDEEQSEYPAARSVVVREGKRNAVDSS
eukprot:gene19021-20933_t